MWVFGTACARGVGDETVKDASVDINCVLPGYKIMDNLQHWPIKRGSVIKAKDIALDPTSNTMYVTKSGTGFEPSILFSAASPHHDHVLNQRQGVGMVRVAGDLRVVL